MFDFELTDAEMEELAALDRRDEGVMDSDRFGH